VLLNTPTFVEPTPDIWLELLILRWQFVYPKIGVKQISISSDRFVHAVVENERCRWCVY